MATNLWKMFQDMIPKTPLMIVEVFAHNADGTSTVTTPDGANFKVIGTSVATGQNAYIKDGNMLGAAPTITLQAEQTI